MDQAARTARISRLLDELCTTHPDRHVGGPGNLAATRLFAEECRYLGLEVAVTAFDCVDWVRSGARLDAAGRSWDVRPGPYSLSCDVDAPLVPVDTVEGLELLGDGRAAGAVLLAHGALVAEQMTPKRYPFYAMDGHTRITAAFERARPAAIVAATGRNPGMTGGLYPYPLFEDADFDVPSAYTTDAEGAALLAAGPAEVSLRIDSSRVAARAEQVVARALGRLAARVVVCGHIDSRDGTPGALDNGTGAAVLLALAEMLASRPPGPTVELVPFNGEDNFAAYGEVVWLAENEGRTDDILLAVNIDAAGCSGHGTHVSLYGCPDALAAKVRAAIGRRDGFAEGPQWPQSDHMVFAMRGIPALAVASENLTWLATEITHTPRDTPDLADPAIVVGIAELLREIAELAAAG